MLPELITFLDSFRIAQVLLLFDKVPQLYTTATFSREAKVSAENVRKEKSVEVTTTAGVSIS